MPAIVGGVPIDHIYPENGLINFTLTECSTFIMLFYIRAVIVLEL